MAEFCPLKDYFGLNALVSKIGGTDDSLQPSRPNVKSVFPVPTGRAETGESSTSSTSSNNLMYQLDNSLSRNGNQGENNNKLLEPLDIIRMSRVYKERLTNVRRRRRPITHCVFCRNNAESEEVYSSHTLKDSQQNITCPILRAYTCPICGANGDHAHTIKYCPYRAQQSHNTGTSFT